MFVNVTSPLKEQKIDEKWYDNDIGIDFLCCNYLLTQLFPGQNLYICTSQKHGLTAHVTETSQLPLT